jgi:hypothetical protein
METRLPRRSRNRRCSVPRPARASRNSGIFARIFHCANSASFNKGLRDRHGVTAVAI